MLENLQQSLVIFGSLQKVGNLQKGSSWPSLKPLGELQPLSKHLDWPLSFSNKDMIFSNNNKTATFREGGGGGGGLSVEILVSLINTWLYTNK